MEDLVKAGKEGAECLVDDARDHVLGRVMIFQ
jgi:hypothetical protein